MSVNYHSLGRQLELRGAPTVLLPPVVRPMPLESALAIVHDHAVEARRQEEARKKRLQEKPADRDQEATEHEYQAVDREQEALWTMLRSTPPPPLTDTQRERTLPQRYPAILRSFAETLRFRVDHYDHKRWEYRAQSSLFAAALTAYARGQPGAFVALKEAHNGLAPNEPDSFSDAVVKQRAFGGDSPEAYLEAIAEPETGDREAVARRQAVAGRLARLQDDVGLTLSAAVNDLADCMAFFQVQPQQPDQGYRGLPTSLVVVQDSQNLTTTVTVTTLVQAADRRAITTALDPQNWQKFSDAFHEVDYVEDGPRGFKRLTQSPTAGEWCTNEKGGQEDNRLLLREVVEVPSGLNPTVIARFENILRIVLHEGPLDARGGDARLTYSLYRCLNSRYLWDERPGGILLDQGYIKVTPLGNPGKTWRVSIRKILRFSDRTPASWADTPLQFGQSLNYLTPASLSWWLQSDMYNAERYTRKYHDQGQGGGGGD